MKKWKDLLMPIIFIVCAFMFFVRTYYYQKTIYKLKIELINQMQQRLDCMEERKQLQNGNQIQHSDRKRKEES
jgi:hypothetical protein